ncbi:MAG TPA: efflux RND transporter permease subunit, partial [Elusimicrobiota bacterium]|nr:efflux RND transporter permease subunit [Elusimicrobiota bacterium]
MLKRWIEFQERQRVLFLAGVAALFAAGGYVALHSEIQAFPELTNVQVQVITQFAGKAAPEVERQVTIPLEVATVGTSGLIGQRSVSLFGLSVITLTFDDNVSLRQARIDVDQRLSDAVLPEGVRPGLSPETTPTGEIFRYVL